MNTPTAAQPLDLDKLSGDIMNIRCDDEAASQGYPDQRYAYKAGHRDARHTAAELVNERAAQARAAQPDTTASASIADDEDFAIALRAYENTPFQSRAPLIEAIMRWHRASLAPVSAQQGEILQDEVRRWKDRALKAEVLLAQQGAAEQHNAVECDSALRAEPAGQHCASILPARRFINVAGFWDADYVEFAEGCEKGGGVLNGDPHPKHYTRSEAESYVAEGAWREVAVPQNVEQSETSRCRAEGGDTSDKDSSDYAAKAPAAQAVTATSLLNADELAALRRFDECAQDGEGYDVPKEMMQRLAEIGVVRRKSGAYYEQTDFGKQVLGNAIQVEPAGTLGYAIFRNGKQQGIERRRGQAESWVDAQIIPLVAASPASTPEASQQADSRAPAPADERALFEEAAKAIYQLLPPCHGCDATTHPWQPGGNSMKQDEARRYAHAALQARAAQQAVPAQPSAARLAKALKDLLQDVRAGVVDGDAARDAQAVLDVIEDADDAAPTSDQQAGAAAPQSVKDERKSFDAYWNGLDSAGATEAEIEMCEYAAWQAWQARPRHCLALPLSAYPKGATYAAAPAAIEQAGASRQGVGKTVSVGCPECDGKGYKRRHSGPGNFVCGNCGGSGNV
jgi:hypothetical protein